MLTLQQPGPSIDRRHGRNQDREGASANGTSMHQFKAFFQPAGAKPTDKAFLDCHLRLKVIRKPDCISARQLLVQVIQNSLEGGEDLLRKGDIQITTPFRDPMTVDAKIKKGCRPAITDKGVILLHAGSVANSEGDHLTYFAFLTPTANSSAECLVKTFCLEYPNKNAVYELTKKSSPVAGLIIFLWPTDDDGPEPCWGITTRVGVRLGRQDHMQMVEDYFEKEKLLVGPAYDPGSGDRYDAPIPTARHPPPASSPPPSSTSLHSVHLVARSQKLMKLLAPSLPDMDASAKAVEDAISSLFATSDQQAISSIAITDVTIRVPDNIARVTLSSAEGVPFLLGQVVISVAVPGSSETKWVDLEVRNCAPSSAPTTASAAAPTTADTAQTPMVAPLPSGGGAGRGGSSAARGGGGAQRGGGGMGRGGRLPPPMMSGQCAGGSRGSGFVAHPTASRATPPGSASSSSNPLPSPDLTSILTELQTLRSDVASVKSMQEANTTRLAADISASTQSTATSIDSAKLMLTEASARSLTWMQGYLMSPEGVAHQRRFQLMLTAPSTGTEGGGSAAVPNADAGAVDHELGQILTKTGTASGSKRRPRSQSRSSPPSRPSSRSSARLAAGKSSLSSPPSANKLTCRRLTPFPAADVIPDSQDSQDPAVTTALLADTESLPA